MSDTTVPFHGNAYRWKLRREDIDRVLHYTHWIPNTRGITQRFFAEHYPGESLSGFMGVFRAAGILLDDGRGAPFGGRCHWRLRHLYFTDAAHWAVDWDESIETDDGAFFYSGERTEETPGRGAVVVEGSELLGSDGEVSDEAIRSLLEQLGVKPPDGSGSA